MRSEYIIDGVLAEQEVTNTGCNHQFITAEIKVRTPWGSTKMQRREYCRLCGIVPHGDGRYDYLCSSEWCRCKQ